MKIEFEQYTCVKDGKVIKTIDCQKFTEQDKIDESRKPCVDWWKENYTKENGAFWYLTDKISKEV